MRALASPWYAMATPRSIWDLPRNDIAAARRFVQAQPDGQVTPTEATTLVRLQDDPTRITAVMRDEGWVMEPPGPSGEDGDVDPVTDPVEPVTVRLWSGGRLIVP